MSGPVALYVFCVACYAVTLCGSVYLLIQSALCARSRFYDIAVAALVLGVLHGAWGAYGMSDSLRKLDRARREVSR